jgi:hypothetical protein
MRAYRSKRDRNPEQSPLIHAEFSTFIAELMSGKRPASARIENLQDGTLTAVRMCKKAGQKSKI